MSILQASILAILIASLAAVSGTDDEDIVFENRIETSIVIG